jgi:chromosome partitioning protein
MGNQMARRRVLAISALKGGVGKTTTAVNLAAASAKRGRRILLVDLDPQGGVATSLGLGVERGAGEWLLGEAELEEVLVREARPGLDVVVSGGQLQAAENDLHDKGPEKRKQRLSRRLAQGGDDGWDAVILDCPPSASLLLENAYRAADELVLPAKLDYLSLPALERTRAFVFAANSTREKPLKIAGVLPTFYDLRTHVSEDVLEALREKFRKILSPIRINAALAEAPSQGKTIYDFDGSARGAVDYLLLAEDLKLG